MLSSGDDCLCVTLWSRGGGAGRGGLIEGSVGPPTANLCILWLSQLLPLSTPGLELVSHC